MRLKQRVEELETKLSRQDMWIWGIGNPCIFKEGDEFTMKNGDKILITATFPRNGYMEYEWAVTYWDYTLKNFQTVEQKTLNRIINE